jgi:hypothetical protein
VAVFWLQAGEVAKVTGYLRQMQCDTEKGVAVPFAMARWDKFSISHTRESPELSVSMTVRHRQLACIDTSTIMFSFMGNHTFLFCQICNDDTINVSNETTSTCMREPSRSYEK